MLNEDLFICDAGNFLSSHGERLHSLRGKELEASWVAWDTIEDNWFQDEAVILLIGGEQLEIVWCKVGEIALTWNSIELDASTFLQVGGYPRVL